MGTFIVVILLLTALFVAIRSMVKKKKNGKSICCSGDCSHCAGCHKNIEKKCEN